MQECFVDCVWVCVCVRCVCIYLARPQGEPVKKRLGTWVLETGTSKFNVSGRYFLLPTDLFDFLTNDTREATDNRDRRICRHVLIVKTWLMRNAHTAIVCLHAFKNLNNEALFLNMGSS